MLVRVAEGVEVVTEQQGAERLARHLVIEVEVEVEVIAILVGVLVVNEYLYLDTLLIADII